MMNNNIFESIGIGSLYEGIILIGLTVAVIVLLILVIVAFVQISKFKKKYEKFMLGKDGNSLEDDIIGICEDNKSMKLSIDKNREDIKELFNKNQLALQKVGLVKYDAFKEMGGKLSFALAILDEKDNGVLINSVHSSDGCYSYTKRIKNGESNIALSNEEKEAVERAVKGIGNSPETE
jgi:DNA-binding transcriptional regulator of glucitol operon